MTEFFAATAIIILLSVLGFWKEVALLFIALAGLSMRLALATPDLLGVTDHTTIGIGLSLVLYSFFCIATAFSLLASNEDEG